MQSRLVNLVGSVKALVAFALLALLVEVVTLVHTKPPDTLILNIIAPNNLTTVNILYPAVRTCS